MPADTAIYVPGKDINRVIITIDPDPIYFMIAKDLGYDLVISHHFTSTMDAWKVFYRHVDLMVMNGIPKEVAYKAVDKRAKALQISYHIKNYDNADSIARLLKIPFMNIHSPLDEIGRRIMQDTINDHLKKRKETTVKEIVDALYQLEEFKVAKTKILVPHGSPESKVEKVVVAHGALTNGGFEVAKTYFDYGFDAVVYIHISPSDLEKLKQYGKGNLIVTGHIASDSVGINPFVRKLEKEGLEVLKLGGVIPPSI